MIKEELGAIRAGIQNYADGFEVRNYTPKIVLVTVVKRHNKRFFKESANGLLLVSRGNTVNTKSSCVHAFVENLQFFTMFALAESFIRCLGVVFTFITYVYFW